MRKIGLLLPLFSIVVILSLLFSCNNNSNSVYESRKYTNIGQRMEQEFLLTHDPALQIVPSHRILDAALVKEQKLAQMKSILAPVPSVHWEERGPDNIGGRTRALLFDLSDASNGYKKVWAGGVSGGLWFTNDITAAVPVWTKIDDMMDNLAISAIVQDPVNHNILYYGTGEGWFNADAVQGAGIWKSVDGGVTWNRMPATANFYFVQDLAIDANGHLYATTRQAGSSGASGLMKSTDGASTWTSVLNLPTASSNRGADIEVAANGDVYVSMGTTGSNGGIYRSVYDTHGALTGNEGTWENITPNASGTIATPANFWNRIELATAPSDANVLYALFQGYNNSNCTSIQQYDAATNTWVVRTVPTIIDQGNNNPFTRGQAFYDLIAAVDPNNANVLYIGGVDVLRSDNGGATWQQMTTWSLFNAPGFNANQYVHADHHALVYPPGNSSRMLLGTDGGVFYTENANIATGKPDFIERNKGYNVTQYYSGYLHPVNTNTIIGGTQDNGSHRFLTAGMNAVQEVTGGDGGFCFIDEDNPNQMITTYTYNNFFISSNGGNSFVSRFMNNHGSFINPMGYHHGSNTIFTGSATGKYFRWANVFAAAPYDTTSVQVAAFAGQRVTHVKVSPTVGRVYFGLSNGSVVKVDDAFEPGNSKEGTVIKEPHAGSVSSIAIDENDENHMLVTYSNYGVVSVYETFNSSSAEPLWTSVEGDLPDMPVRWAVFDPRNSGWALLATELGVWSTNNLNGSLTEWSPTNSGLANVRVDMLQLRESDNTLLAATHGRGIFTAVIPGVTTPDVNFATSGITLNESGTLVEEDCRKYQEYQFYVTIANAPEGDATITLSVMSGTATQGVDFDFTTNGDFNSPSESFIFPDGETNPIPVSVRIYDDAEVEVNENVVFSYTISGATDAQSGIGHQLYELIIEDNDIEPSVSSMQNLILTDASLVYLRTATDGQILNSKLAGKRTMLLYTAEELLALGAQAGEFTQIGFNFLKASTRSFDQIQIKMAHTTTSNFLGGSGLVVVNGAIVSTVTNYTVVDGWNNFALNSPFNWNGTDNIVIEVCYQNATEDASENYDSAIGFMGADPASSYMYWQNNTTCAGNFSGTASYFSGYKPILNFRITTQGNAIATSTVLKNEYFNANNNLNIYTNSNEIIAEINNLSAHNFGCLDVEIDREGTGAQYFWNNNDENRILDKTFYFNPDNALPSANYEVVLYYSQEEVEGWELATGNSFDDILLIKTSGRVSEITPMNTGDAEDVEIVIPVRGTFGTGRTLSYTFNSGFSGFAAGIVGQAVPVKLTSFEGSYKEPEINLRWETVYELNNKGFEIEKSEDGTNFRNIGFVPSFGNHNEVKHYTFTDKNVFINNNFYRLKQIDLDNRVSYSSIINIKKPATALAFRILQNPVQSAIDIQFNEVPNVKIHAELFDNTGRVLAVWNQPVLRTLNMKLALPAGRLATGNYVLRLTYNGNSYTEQIIAR